MALARPWGAVKSCLGVEHRDGKIEPADLRRPGGGDLFRPRHGRARPVGRLRGVRLAADRRVRLGPGVGRQRLRRRHGDHRARRAAGRLAFRPVGAGQALPVGTGLPRRRHRRRRLVRQPLAVLPRPRHPRRLRRRRLELRAPCGPVAALVSGAVDHRARRRLRVERPGRAGDRAVGAAVDRTDRMAPGLPPDRARAAGIGAVDTDRAVAAARPPAKAHGPCAVRCEAARSGRYSPSTR